LRPTSDATINTVAGWPAAPDSACSV